MSRPAKKVGYPASGEVACNAALQDVIAERVRQISVEGWTPEHDDEHAGCQMAQAAAAYAVLDTPGMSMGETYRLWPWSRAWWKPKDRRRNLVRAAALLIAEIERIDRADSQA